MTEKQIIDRLDSINLSLRQKKDLIDIIKDITANSSGGGGTSTDKDALDIYMDFANYTITFNDKIFTADFSDSDNTAAINNKELYNTLYNALSNTNTIVHVHIHFTKEQFGYAIPTIIWTDDRVVFQMLADAIITIIVFNR